MPLCCIKQHTYAQPAQDVLAGGEAIARGMYHGVAQLADSTYWKNRALGMVEAVKFIRSLLAEDACLENWEAEYRTATVTGNQETCDQLLERFEKHEFQPLSSAEQGIRQTCIQLQTLSWDQLVEHGAQLATSLALDCLILKAGEFALSPAGRAFMHDITETLKLPKAQAQEHMVEFAGIGKISLEESSDVATAVVKSIQKNPGVLAQEGKTTVQVMHETAQEITTIEKSPSKISEWSKISAQELKKIGEKSLQSDIRQINGSATDAFNFFKAQVENFITKEPGEYFGKDKNGVIFYFRDMSKSGPPTIDVNGIKGIRKIKFIEK